MKRHWIAIATIIILGMHSVSAEAQDRFVCWSGIITPDGTWTGEQKAVEFEISLKEILGGQSFTKVVVPGEIPRLNFGGILYFYAARIDTDRDPQLTVGIFHLNDAMDVTFGSAVANYSPHIRRLYLYGDSYTQGLKAFTLSCEAAKRRESRS